MHAYGYSSVVKLVTLYHLLVTEQRFSVLQGKNGYYYPQKGFCFVEGMRISIARCLQTTASSVVGIFVGMVLSIYKKQLKRLRKRSEMRAERW